MRAPFLKLGDRIINPDHIVTAKWFEAAPERTDWDDDIRADRTFKAIPASIELTLTSLEYYDNSFDGRDGYKPDGGGVSETIKFSGAQAERLWAWLTLRADNLSDEPVDQAAPA